MQRNFPPEFRSASRFDGIVRRCGKLGLAAKKLNDSGMMMMMMLSNSVGDEGASVGWNKIKPNCIYFGPKVFCEQRVRDRIGLR